MSKRKTLSVDLNKLNVGEARGLTRRRGNNKSAREAQFFEHLVQEAYQAFMDEGQPSAVADRPGRYVEAPDRPEVIHEIKKAVRDAADHLGVGIRFGELERSGRGRVRVTFTAQNRKDYSSRRRITH